MLKNLKLLRNERHISQQQLADMIGVSQQSVNKYENHNVEPDLTTLIAIADFFDTSVDYIIGHTTNRYRIEPRMAFELNEQEGALITQFRLLQPSERELFTTLIQSLSKTK